MISRFISALYDPLLPLPKEEKFYSAMLADHDFNSVAPQVYHLLNKRGMLVQTPLFFQTQLKELFNETFYKNLFIKNQTMQLLKKFEELETQVIPLKGVFFSEKYFGHLGARATTDIDLLIHYPDLGKASEIVKSLGFTVEEKLIPNHFHYSFSKNIPGSPVPLVVELHWNLVKEYTADFDVKEIWDQAHPFNSFKNIKELTKYHTFYFICLHGWRHNLNSIRYYLDIVQLIHLLSEEIDYSQLINDAIKHKTSKRIIRTISLVYHEFQHLNSFKKFEMKRTLTYLGDLKGMQKYIDIIDYQFLNYDSSKHGIKELKVWIKDEGQVAFLKKIKHLINRIRKSVKD